MEFTISLLLELAAKHEASEDAYERGLGAGLRIAANAMQNKLSVEQGHAVSA